MAGPTDKKTKLNSKLESKNAFMIKYFQSNKHNDHSMHISCFDQRRVVFISLLGLYRTWTSCPSFVLYAAIFILPIKTEWISPPKYHRLRKHSTTNPNDSTFDHEMHTLFLNLAESKEFIELLKWKDSQCLLFCTLDDHEQSDTKPLINPFWSYLSKQLINIYNPVTQKQYKPILLDTKWWCEEQYISKYDTKPPSILCELYFLTMKYKTMQEIMYQSNPESLCPIISYDDHVSMHRSRCKLETDLGEYITEDERNDWVCTGCYDPYDIDDVVSN